MKSGRKMLVASLALLTFTTPAFAWMDGWQGYYGNNRPTLSAEQQQQVKKMESRYDKELKDLEAQLDAKQNELSKARAEGTTTMATYNALQAELSALENTYRAKLGQANQEVWQVTGSGTAPWFACDYQGCDHSNGRHGMMNSRGMMQDSMMVHGNVASGSQHGTCCW